MVTKPQLTRGGPDERAQFRPTHAFWSRDPRRSSPERGMVGLAGRHRRSDQHQDRLQPTVQAPRVPRSDRPGATGSDFGSPAVSPERPSDRPQSPDAQIHGSSGPEASWSSPPSLPRTTRAAQQVRAGNPAPEHPSVPSKDERQGRTLHSTLLREWAYARPYSHSRLRARSLKPWLRYYNQRRPHGSLDGKPPVSRLRQAREQRA
jgi:transposase InsO family protein